MEAWLFARQPLNLREYGEVDTRWYWECRLALNAWADGKAQGGDVARQIAEQTTPLRVVK